SLLRDLPPPVAGQRGEAALTCVHHVVRLLIISRPTPEGARQRRTPSVFKVNTQGAFVICADRVREWLVAATSRRVVRPLPAAEDYPGSSCRPCTSGQPLQNAPHLLFREGAHRHGANGALQPCAQGQPANGLIVWGFNDQHDVVLALRPVVGGHLGAECLSRLAGGGGPSDRLLRGADTLVGPVEQHDIGWHVVLLFNLNWERLFRVERLLSLRLRDQGVTQRQEAAEVNRG